MAQQKVTIRFDAVSVAYLSGSLKGAASILYYLGGKPKVQGLTNDDWGSPAVPQAMKRFGKSWDFRRKYLVKEIKSLASAATKFAKDISDADQASRDFLKQVTARAEKGPGV